jgi:hypothetical protein
MNVRIWNSFGSLNHETLENRKKKKGEELEQHSRIYLVFSNINLRECTIIYYTYGLISKVKKQIKDGLISGSFSL